MDTSSVRWQLTDAQAAVARVYGRRWRWLLSGASHDEALLVQAMSRVHACSADVPAAHDEALRVLLKSMDALDQGLTAGGFAGWRMWQQRGAVAQVVEGLDGLVAALLAAAPDTEAVPVLVGSSERRQRVRTERSSTSTVRTAG